MSSVNLLDWAVEMEKQAASKGGMSFGKKLWSFFFGAPVPKKVVPNLTEGENILHARGVGGGGVTDAINRARAAVGNDEAFNNSEAINHIMSGIQRQDKEQFIRALSRLNRRVSGGTSYDIGGIGGATAHDAKRMDQLSRAYMNRVNRRGYQDMLPNYVDKDLNRIDSNMFGDMHLLHNTNTGRWELQGPELRADQANKALDTLRNERYADVYHQPVPKAKVDRRFT